MKNRKKRRRFLVVAFLILVVIGLALVGGYLMVVGTVQAEFGRPSSNLSPVQRIIFPMELFFNRRGLLEPQVLMAAEQTFSISEGESVAMVCIRLEKAGLIPDAELMRMYLVYIGLDRVLKSGQFSLNPSMSPVQIAAALLDATPTDAVVTILPGWRIEEVAVNVAGSGLSITADAFIAAAYSPTEVHLAILPVSDLPTLEGFLFPGTYVLPRESNLEDLLVMILSAFAEQVDATIREGFERQGLSVGEAVNLASIVQREAVVADEKPLIASVFLNRLAIGMRLETDPTVQYALGIDENTGSWWKSPLYLGDLAVESPYNTYQNPGLPPGPISNPDLGSLWAVAFPAETPYYFFRAACDGSGRHNFAVTFEEHLGNACE
ncbi:MAG: endolytic transglycosylase MltG [Brevefilum sp.]